MRVGQGIEAEVGQALPAAADADDLVADLGRPVDDRLDDRVQARDVAAAGQDSDPSRSTHGAGIVPLGRGSGVGCGTVTAAATGAQNGTCIVRLMNYELFMGEALAEARNAIAAGERPNAAVAVVDEAMVARAHDRVLESGDPTAHAVIVALREAARKLGPRAARRRDDLHDDRAVRDVRRRAAGERRRRARLRAARTRPRAPPEPSSSSPSTRICQRRIQIVSGIRRDEAMELLAGTTAIA